MDAGHIGILAVDSCAVVITYAVGFVARPLGGIVFGHYGDKYGRKKLLQLSLVLVGGATFLMGCLPTFNQIGYWAPALLVVLRFIQGFAVGGEWGGAVLLVAEHSPNKSRGFWASWPQAGVPVGNLLATVVLLVLTTTLSDATFFSWGWRIAFWLSAVIVFIGYYIRTKVTDAPIFVEAQKQAAVIKAASYGVFEVVKRYPRGVFTAMGLRFGENVMYYLVVTFTITYLKVEVGTDTQTILWWMLAAHAVHFCAIPLVGKLADRIGRRPVYLPVQLPRALGDSSPSRCSTAAITPSSWQKCSRRACAIPVSPWAIRSPRSSPVRWPRSSQCSCSTDMDPRFPSPGLWPGRALLR